MTEANETVEDATKDTEQKADGDGGPEPGEQVSDQADGATGGE